MNLETNLLVQQFNNLNIEIYGTYEEPLFKAKDIGNLLGIEKIRDTISKMDNESKVLQIAPAGITGTSREQWFLTEDGLYEILFISRKPIAKQFRLWGVLDKAFITQTYKIKK